MLAPPHTAITSLELVTERMDHIWKPFSTAGETAVALGKVGRENLGFVGDVNREKGCNAAILAMCGLLK